MKILIIPIALLLAISGVFLLTNSFTENTNHFFGITDNKEQSVSFSEPVEITEIRVIEGQYVEQGTVLLKAKRSELSAQQEQLNGQIDELDARQNESKAKLNAEINVLRAKKRAELLSVDAQIRQLQSKRQFNNDLYKSITGDAPAVSTSDPLQQQIQSLGEQRGAIASAIQAQINSLKTQLRASEQPIYEQKKQVTERLDDINRQAEDLTIRADFTGRIGSINIKQGERIPSFQSVMTVHGLYPEYVKGYIHENVSNDVKIGQQVWVHSSYNNRGITVRGSVESLGSRIVEYPDRLKKNVAMRSWGREVNIRLKMDNPLLLGEKVQISFTSQRPNTKEAFLNPFGIKIGSAFPGAVAGQISDKEIGK